MQFFTNRLFTAQNVCESINLYEKTKKWEGRHGHREKEKETGKERERERTKRKK